MKCYVVLVHFIKMFYYIAILCPYCPSLSFSTSSCSLALLMNLDLSFSYSYVLTVLWKVCCTASTFPTHVSLVSVSLCFTHTHQYASVSGSLSVVSPPLSPCHPSGSSLVFVQQLCASGPCCVKVLPTVSSLSRASGYLFPMSTHSVPLALLFSLSLS